MSIRERADNWIAADLGVGGKTVRVVREEMETASEIPRWERLVGRDGRERPRAVERAVGEGESAAPGVETPGGDELGSSSATGDDVLPDYDAPTGQVGRERSMQGR